MNIKQLLAVRHGCAGSGANDGSVAASSRAVEARASRC
jgi:hypothetical protein